jgi:26S proteasome regulatory subunit T5
MSALPPAEPPNNNGQPNDANKSESDDSSSAQAEVAEMDTTPDQPAEETWDDIPEEIMELDTEDILTRIRLIDNDIKVRCFPFVGMQVESSLQLGHAFRAVAVKP